MKRTNNVKNSFETPLRCNCCGREIKSENGILIEDAFEATKEWGYFSSRDMDVHQFNLCEECYDEITSKFKIPVQIKEKHEVI